MPGAVNVRKRPSLWSYLSFNSSPVRRQSISLPTRCDPNDPFEKPDRHLGNGEPGGFTSDSKGAWMNQSQRSRLVKIGGVLAVFALFIIFLTSGGKGVTEYAKDHTVGHGGQIASDPSVGTTKCSKSSHASKPLIQYALMIDAGSTGSRIHVYRFNNCGSSPELEKEDFKMTEKKEGGSGLSSYANDPEQAAKSLDVLLDLALETVPDKLKSCTPIAVKATAGLRKLGEEKSKKILDAVRNRLETVYPFPVVAKEKGGVQIMDGSDEGVYAWITTNYLLGKIGGPDKTPTAAVFDLGGGSTQIVFQPTFKSASGGMPETLAEGDHKYELDFGGRHFELYQHSHLGYGLMEARKSIHQAVFQSASEHSSSSRDWISQGITNPCIAPGTSRIVEVALESGNTVKVNMTGPETGSPAQCRGVAEKILSKDKHCTLAPCSFQGVYQPSLEKTFAREDVYIFSYFYDRTQPLGMPESFTIRELHDLAAQVCGGAEHWDVFSGVHTGVHTAIEELQGRPEHCLDLNFMLALLHTGYEMPIDREVKIAKKIKDNELGWCLGASLPLLSQESGWTCRIQEITK